MEIPFLWLMWKSSQVYSYIWLGQLKTSFISSSKWKSSFWPFIIVVHYLVNIFLQHCLDSIPLNGEDLLAPCLTNNDAKSAETTEACVNCIMLGHEWMELRQHLLPSRDGPVPSFPSALCSLIQSCLLYFFTSSKNHQWDKLSTGMWLLFNRSKFVLLAPHSWICGDIVGTEMTTHFLCSCWGSWGPCISMKWDSQNENIFMINHSQGEDMVYKLQSSTGVHRHVCVYATI